MTHRIVVTGGSGHAGTAVVQALVEQGCAVLSVDRVAPRVPISPYMLADLEDIGQCYGVLADADALVHLAAIPRPTFVTPEQVFRTNMMTQFNLFEAAYRLGLARIVVASSVSVLGFPFFVAPLAPRSVPIDESHPRLPQDAYAISKHLGEELADAFVRRAPDRLSIISLRYPWIHTPETFRAQIIPLQTDRAAGASNLWSYVDARDVGASVWLALTADVRGHEAFFISAAHSFMPDDSADLVREFYPSTEIRPTLTGRRSLLDYGKAARLLGYAPQFSWADYG